MYQHEPPWFHSRIFLIGVRQPGREGGRSPHPTAKAKDEWSHASTTPLPPKCLYGVVSDSCLLYATEEENSKYCQLANPL